MSECDDVVEPGLPDVPFDLTQRHDAEPTEFKRDIYSAEATAALLSNQSAGATPRQLREMLIVISVTTDDKRLPFWINSLRLLSRAIGVIIYIFGTSVFGSVGLLALPMEQMILVLIMGAGMFGRAITSGLISIVAERTPVMHVLADDEETADRVLRRVLQY